MKQKLLIVIFSLLCLTAKAQKDSTCLSGPIGPYAYGWGWHKGLNVDLSLSVMTQFGKNRRHGAGFGQRLNAIYLTPLTDKLWLAAGGTVSNILWSGDSYRQGAVYAALGYRFNEHWEAYAWVQKQVASNMSYGFRYPRTGYYYAPMDYDIYGYGDRIGGAIKYNLNPNFSFQISIESVNIPSRELQYFDQYNYPVPKD